MSDSNGPHIGQVALWMGKWYRRQDSNLRLSQFVAGCLSISSHGGKFLCT